MNFDFISPMMIRESKNLVFMNFDEGKVYKIAVGPNSELVLVELEESLLEDCMDDLENKRKELEPELPVEDMMKVLNTEKELSEQNEKHIFRKGSL